MNEWIITIAISELVANLLKHQSVANSHVQASETVDIYGCISIQHEDIQDTVTFTRKDENKLGRMNKTILAFVEDISIFGGYAMSSSSIS
ncbi:hypothetical protein WAI453_003801 [Rhynchosporium graminicola]